MNSTTEVGIYSITIKWIKLGPWLQLHTLIHNPFSDVITCFNLQEAMTPPLFYVSSTLGILFSQTSGEISGSLQEGTSIKNILMQFGTYFVGV